MDYMYLINAEDETIAGPERFLSFDQEVEFEISFPSTCKAYKVCDEEGNFKHSGHFQAIRDVFPGDFVRVRINAPRIQSVPINIEDKFDWVEEGF